MTNLLFILYYYNIKDNFFVIKQKINALLALEVYNLLNQEVSKYG